MNLKFIILITIFSFIALFNSNQISAGENKMDFKNIKLNNTTKIKYLYRDNIPIVYVTVVIPASPLDEEKASQAYLTAHMLTYGTKNRSARQIEEEIDFLAISIEKKVTHDYTMLTLATTKRNLKKAIELFFDILQNPIFPEDEFRREVSILEKSLKQMEKEPSFIANKTFFKNLFGEHPYGRPVEGEPEKLKELKREDLIIFYEKFYKPDRMIFSFIGDINEIELNEIFTKFLDNRNIGETDRKIKQLEFSKRNKPIEILIKREDLTQSTIVLGFEGISRKDPDFYAFSIMNYVLGGGGLTSRLAKQVREEQGLAYSIYSNFNPYLLPGAFFIEVKTKTENTRKVVNIIIEELKSLKDKGISDEELREAKAFLIGSFPLRIDTMKKISQFLPLIDFYDLGDDYIDKYPQYIDNVSTNDIKIVINKYININSYLLVVVGKDR